jgi:hypothetical protein
MFCPNCGTSVKDSDQACPNCGAPLAEARAVQQQPPYQPAAPQQPPPAYQAAPPPPAQGAQQPYYPPPQQTYLAYQQPYPQAQSFGARQQPVSRPNFLISKIMIVVGVAMAVCFFLSWIGLYGYGVATGWHFFIGSFQVFASLGYFIQYSGYMGGAAGITIFLTIMMAIFMFLTIFIPLAGALSLLALTNSRGGVKTVNTFAALGMSGMLGFLAMVLIASTLAGSAVSEYANLGLPSLALSAFAFPFWVCLIGSLVLVIGTGIDLSKNKPQKYFPPPPYQY